MSQARLREALNSGGPGTKDRTPPVADGILSITPNTPEAEEWKNRRSAIDSAVACSSYLDDSDDGPSTSQPSELYGKFTWRIEKFSEISKRELRSTIFEVGSYKWYILVYPQGCDVCNHLSLFLCVADYDKLLPGWTHFAQFTIAVVNKEPKKSKYSDTLHRFCKKEHDWGWKKFMEVSKILEGFTVQDTLVIKAQVQVIRERPGRPFRCLDGQYRRELVRVYLTNVEGICRRFLEEKREKLTRMAKEHGFGKFWSGLSDRQQRELVTDRAELLLKGLVKKFFNEKEVTSTLVMDALYCGCKLLEYASRKFLAGSINGTSPLVLIDAERGLFSLNGNIVSVLERAVNEALPPTRDEGKPPEPVATRSPGEGDDYNRDSVDRDEQRLAELGRRSVEMWGLAYLFGERLETAFSEAESIKRQDALIKEEEEQEKEEEKRARERAEADKEKKQRKKERQKAKKEADRKRREEEEAERSQLEAAKREESDRRIRELSDKRTSSTGSKGEDLPRAGSKAGRTDRRSMERGLSTESGVSGYPVVPSTATSSQLDEGSTGTSGGVYLNGTDGRTDCALESTADRAAWGNAVSSSGHRRTESGSLPYTTGSEDELTTSEGDTDGELDALREQVSILQARAWEAEGLLAQRDALLQEQQAELQRQRSALTEREAAMLQQQEELRVLRAQVAALEDDLAAARVAAAAAATAVDVGAGDCTGTARAVESGALGPKPEGGPDGGPAPTSSAFAQMLTSSGVDQDDTDTTVSVDSTTSANAVSSSPRQGSGAPAGPPHKPRAPAAAAVVSGGVGDREGPPRGPAAHQPVNHSSSAGVAQVDQGAAAQQGGPGKAGGPPGDRNHGGGKRSPAARREGTQPGSSIRAPAHAGLGAGPNQGPKSNKSRGTANGSSRGPAVGRAGSNYHRNSNDGGKASHGPASHNHVGPALAPAAGPPVRDHVLSYRNAAVGATSGGSSGYPPAPPARTGASMQNGELTSHYCSHQQPATASAVTSSQPQAGSLTSSTDFSSLPAGSATYKTHVQHTAFAGVANRLHARPLGSQSPSSKKAGDLSENAGLDDFAHMGLITDLLE